MSKEKNKGVAAGVALGAVLGVITGILFAPKSGKETRKDIKDASNKAIAKLQEKAEQVQNDLTDLIEKVEEKFVTTKDSATKKSKDMLQTAKDAQIHLRVVAKAIKNGGADDKDLDKAIKKAQEARKALADYLKK